jgi:methyltransferase (TIGR00027 family)
MVAEPNKMSLKYQPSETATVTAFMRALAWYDNREEIKGPDYLAEAFLTPKQKAVLKDPKIRNLVLKNRLDPGAYEYMIARTAFFDDMVWQALKDGVPQIVFLGAGYDTRPYRFRSLTSDVRFFELDTPPTQQRKQDILHQACIDIPEQVVFVPFNFETDSLEKALLGAGYYREQKSLFVWEGVTYYLTADAVDATLEFVKTNSAAGSSICFDYASLSMDAYKDTGVQKIHQRMRSRYATEPTRFGIREGKLDSFLAERGFKTIEYLTSEGMEHKYLTLRDDSSIGKVPPLFCLVHALVAS